MHQDKSGGVKEFGTVTLELKDLLQGELKRTPQAVVRVSDQYLPIKVGGD